MKATEFKIATQADAKRFNQLLNQYRLEQKIHQWPFISLEDAYAALASHPNSAQAFSAFFDIYLQDFALQRNLKIIQNETNREYAGGDVDVEAFFSHRIERYIAASNTALRLRTLWDKSMGFMVLLNWPNKYQDFLNGKSRLRAFKKIASEWKLESIENQNKLVEEWNEKWEQSINRIEVFVRAVDDNFRTAEAHAVGRIGKWAFIKQENEDDPFEELLLAANNIYEYLGELSFVLRIYLARK